MSNPPIFGIDNASHKLFYLVWLMDCREAIFKYFFNTEESFLGSWSPWFHPYKVTGYLRKITLNHMYQLISIETSERVKRKMYKFVP